MTNSVEKSGLPGWLKVVLISSVVFIVLSIGLVVGCVSFLTNWSKEAQDPNRIKQIASSFMKIREPLPDGFKYLLALDLFGNKIVQFKKQDSDLSIVFCVFKEPTSDMTDNEKLLNKVPSFIDPNDINAKGRSQIPPRRKFELEREGSQLVGGRKMTYAIGKAVDTKRGGSRETFVGRFPATASGCVCIVGTTGKDTYDIASTNDLLNSIEQI
jgi:hypothetical protein